MKGYRFAIQWLVDNDDNEWLRNGEDALSVSASLVADFAMTENPIFDPTAWGVGLAKTRASVTCCSSALKNVFVAYETARLISSVPPINMSERKIVNLRDDLMTSAHIAAASFGYEKIVWC